MITPSFSLTATERVLPKLALDFTTATLDPRVTFTRTTGASNPATYVDNSGYIASATNNQPRFDYDPVTLACKGLLIEESRTNALAYSSDFSNAQWLKTNGSLTGTDVLAAPDGTVTADYFAADASTSQHTLQYSTSFVAGTTYTASVFVKPDTAPNCYLRFGATTAFTNPTLVSFNLTTGAVNSALNATGQIQAFPNGWFRVSMTATAVSTAVGYFQPTILDSTFTGNVGNGNGLYFWGAQLETGAFATSYIPTTTTALTRNADVATMTGTNFSDWFNASEGTFVLDGYVNKPQTSTMFILGNGSTNRFIYDSNFGATVNEYRNYDGVNVSSPRQAAIGFNKVASAYNSATNNKAVCVNGGSVASGAYNGAWSTNTVLNIFETRSSGWAKSLLYYPQRLTDAELQAFTK